MKKVFSKTAFTLMELIVALILVSIILLGIVSVNLVLNSNGTDYGQRYLVKSTTQITLNHILNDASQAVGSGIPGNTDLAILTRATAPTMNAEYDFCIHQQSPAYVAALNPNGDIWICYMYSFYGSGNLRYQQIWECSVTFSADGTVTRGTDQTCNYPTPATSNTTTALVGSAFSISENKGVLTPPTFYTSPGPPNPTLDQMSFVITITNCLNNATPPGNCSANGTSTDPVSNPEVQLSGSVAPPAVGSG